MGRMIEYCRLGRDAELRSTQDGTPVASLALAYNYGRRENGQQPTQWVQASLWGKRAESTVQYLTKGTAIEAVLSDVHIETFQKQDGTQGAALRARLDDFQFAGGGQQQQTPQQQSQQSTPQQYQQASGGGVDPDLDSEIPF